MTLAKRLAPLVAAMALAAPLTGPLPAAAGAQTGSFAKGFPADAGFFPIGVWLQNPRNAALYKAFGINTFVALWKGPTETQLGQLAEQGMYAVANQSPEAMSLPSADVIRAWMQVDEPDNAQKLPIGGYGDCILPDELLTRYAALKSADSTRPVLLNFGQGLANPAWAGRGSKCARLDHDSYYSAAAKAADIVSFDIYPATEERQPSILGRIDLVGEGTRKLRQWAAPAAKVWAFVETTHVKSPEHRPTAAEVRAEIWMAIVHGARGIVYFVHEWKPTFREDAIFRYPEIAAEVGRSNALIARLAPVLNSQAPLADVAVEAGTRIATLSRRHGGALWLIAVNMERKASKATFKLPATGTAQALALGEDRIIPVHDAALHDDFAPHGVHIYRIEGGGR